MSNVISRRGFLLGVAAAGYAAAAQDMVARDENFSVFLSDPHVPGDGTELDKNHVEHDPAYMYKRLAATVDEVLAMRPMPARVVVFGDIAYLRGERADYEKTKPLFDKLAAEGIDVVFIAYLRGERADYEKTKPLFDKLAAEGIDVVFGMGNHDHRAAFFDTYPGWRERTCVPGDVVTKVSLGHADLLMLDTLTENTSAPGVTNPGNGSLSERQAEWLALEATKATRPFFVGAHHHIHEVGTKVGGKSLGAFLIKQPLFRGYIHGHHHFWKTDRLLDWGRYTVRRVATLPSVGFWGDLGHALFRTAPHLAQLRPVIREFCFPRHQPDPAAAIVADAQNATCRFPLDG